MERSSFWKILDFLTLAVLSQCVLPKLHQTARFKPNYVTNPWNPEELYVNKYICEITWLQPNLAMQWIPHQMKENTNRNRKRVCILHVCIIQKRVRSPGVLYQIRLGQRRVKGNWIPLLSHLLSSSSMRTVPNTWYKYKYMIHIQIHDTNTNTNTC